MSFWSRCPGPSWWHCIESLNPCAQTAYGLCTENLLQREKTISLPKGFTILPLKPNHSEKLAFFLKTHFSIYPRCRISLSKERILKGFLKEQWIGVGIFSLDGALLGCCISKPLGNLKFPHEIVPRGGLVDYFCVHKNYRKQGFAVCLLEELLRLTALEKRYVHVFLKEGFPLFSLPPLYHSRYLARRKGPPGSLKEYFGSQGIALHTPIQSYSHADFFPLTKFAANLPFQLSGDSELFGFNYKGHDIYLCMTDLHHRSVPDGETIGELSWMLPKTIEVPLSIQRLAVETCVDCSKFDIVLMDANIPHDTKKPWGKDATFSWYIFNYNPGEFFTLKPFWIM
jgi:hypothetical protein